MRPRGRCVSENRTEGYPGYPGTHTYIDRLSLFINRDDSPDKRDRLTGRRPENSQSVAWVQPLSSFEERVLCSFAGEAGPSLEILSEAGGGATRRLPSGGDGGEKSCCAASNSSSAPRQL